MPRWRVPADHPNLAESLESYAVLLRKMKRDKEAEAFEARAGTVRAKLAAKAKAGGR